MTVFLARLWRFITNLRIAVFNTLFLLILVVLIASFFSQDSIEMPDQAVLVFNPAQIVEQHIPIDPFNELLGGNDGQRRSLLLRDVLDALDHASDDERIKALLIDTSKLGGISLSTLQRIGTALTAFKASGKPVYAYAKSYDQAQYYLAAHADQIYLNSMEFGAFSNVVFQGFGVYPMFYREALEKLRLKIHVFRVGTYKSAVEPFLRDDMSAESKEATLGWLNVLWDAYRGDITRLRSLSADAFDDYITRFDTHLDDVSGDLGQLALRHGLVDKLVDRDEFRQELIDIVGKGGRSSETFNQIDLSAYVGATQPTLPESGKAGDRIAVIVASGIILDGDQPPGTIGSVSLGKLIEKARKNDRVKAVVLRVNSPGGSATASEDIRYELTKTQQAGKPIVVSMGSVAASGGYWIASTADQIFATPTTITGSIGIYAMMPELTNTFSAMGVRSDGVGTTDLAAATNPLIPLSPVFKRTLQQSIEKGYEQFIGLVARGRHLALPDVNRIAQGRVWAGSTALELGLVDQLGTLDDAIAAAADLAELDDWQPLYLEKDLSPRARLLQDIMESTMAELVAFATPDYSLLTPITREVLNLTRFNDPQGIYLHCVECVDRRLFRPGTR